MEHAQIEWNNGVPTSAACGDIYYATEGGLEETAYVFLQHNGLPGRWRGCAQFCILETGFGTGLNFCATLQAWKASGARGRLHYFSIEKYPLSPDDMRRVALQWPQLHAEFECLLAQYPPPVRGQHLLEFEDGRVRLYLCFDDVVQALARLQCVADAIYLDGFVPSLNPVMWSDDVMTGLARQSRAGTRFSTFTAAGHVRRALAGAGFKVRKVKGFGRKREMLAGEMASRPYFQHDAPWYARPASHTGTRECTILGAGLAGLAVAHALSRRGWRMTLVDRHPQPGAGASGNPAGLLAPRLSRLYTEDARFYAIASLYAARVLADLCNEGNHGEPCWFDSGLLLIERAAQARETRYSEEYPPAFIDVVDEERANALSGLHLDRAAHYLPLMGYVKPALLCGRLLASCDDRLRTLQMDVTDITRSGNTWRLTGPNETHHTDTLVLANAATAASYAFSDWLPLSSSRGQIGWFEPTGERELRCPLSGERYVTPALAQGVIAGASYAGPGDGQAEHAISAADHHAIYDGLCSMLGTPVVQALINKPQADDSVQGRVAFRCTTPDRAPVVGALPDVQAYRAAYADLHHGPGHSAWPDAAYLPGLYVTSGHGSRGLSSCLLSGEVLAALMNNEPLPIDRPQAEFIHPGRFLVRALKRRGPE